MVVEIYIHPQADHVDVRLESYQLLSVKKTVNWVVINDPPPLDFSVLKIEQVLELYIIKRKKEIEQSITITPEMGLGWKTVNPTGVFGDLLREYVSLDNYRNQTNNIFLTSNIGDFKEWEKLVYESVENYNKLEEEARQQKQVILDHSEKIQEYEREEKMLRSKINCVSNQSEELENENKFFFKTVGCQEKTIKRMQGEIDNLKREFDKMCQENVELKKENNLLIDKNEALKKIPGVMEFIQLIK